MVEMVLLKLHNDGIHLLWYIPIAGERKTYAYLPINSPLQYFLFNTFVHCYLEEEKTSKKVKVAQTFPLI